MQVDLVPKSGLADRSNQVETDHICLDFRVVSAKEIDVEGVLPECTSQEGVIKCQRN